MRIGNIAGRAHLLIDTDLAIDLGDASKGRWSDPQTVFAKWDEFQDWARRLDSRSARPYDASSLSAPVPRPRQVFAIGLNFQDHADETKFAPPAEPTVFTKFPTSITGPFSTVDLPEGDVDWEVEMVLVIGRAAYKVLEEDAWTYVAGVTVGQDLSERRAQLAGPAPQFSLAKSHVGFAPIGPVVVTPDELADRENLELGCKLNGEIVQKGLTKDMVFTVSSLISRLSAVAPLLPGDLIFTGTPSGVGMARTPPRYLTHGDELVSYVEGVGEIHTTFASVRREPRT